MHVLIRMIEVEYDGINNFLLKATLKPIHAGEEFELLLVRPCMNSIL